MQHGRGAIEIRHRVEDQMPEIEQEHDLLQGHQGKADAEQGQPGGGDFLMELRLKRQGEGREHGEIARKTFGGGYRIIACQPRAVMPMIFR